MSGGGKTHGKRDAPSSMRTDGCDVLENTVAGSCGSRSHVSARGKFCAAFHAADRRSCPAARGALGILGSCISPLFFKKNLPSASETS
jgi:hypothetical protein